MSSDCTMGAFESVSVPSEASSESRSAVLRSESEASGRGFPTSFSKSSAPTNPAMSTGAFALAHNLAVA
jgi:hypothetical protein